MNTRLGIAGFAVVVVAAGGCFVQGGFAARTPSAASSGDEEATTVSSGSRDDRGAAKGAFQITTSGHKPKNDVEQIALRLGVRAVREELERMQERCGVTIPVEIMYADPMSTWVGAEGWGNHRKCTHDADTGGCINLSVCGSQVLSMFWFDLCGGPDEGIKRAYRGWNTKVKRLVCRGEASPPETSAAEHDHSKMSAVLSDDGTLTVTLHPSDSNVSTEVAAFLGPRLEAE